MSLVDDVYFVNSDVGMVACDGMMHFFASGRLVIIVTIAKHNVISLSGLKAEVTTDGNSGILGSLEEADAGVFFKVFLDNIKSVICRVVINADNFYIFKGLMDERIKASA